MVCAALFAWVPLVFVDIAPGKTFRGPRVRRMNRLSTLLACLALATSVPAQEEDAELLFGTVTALDGTPWSGAVVRLRSRPMPRLDGFGTLDAREAITDARGRFRSEVLPGRSYVVWAQGSDGADGGRRITGVVERAVAREPLFLRERTRVRRSGAVALDGLELKVPDDG